MSEWDVNRRADLVRRLTEIVNASNEANSNDAGFRMPRPGGASDSALPNASRLASSQRALERDFPDLGAMVGRIKTGGY